MKKELKGLGVDIFAGGFTVGVKKHFNVVAHLEENDYGVATAQHNFPDLPIHIGEENWPLDVLKAMDLDFVYGNPPCAAWSVAGYTKTRGPDKWKTDERVNCTLKHFSLIEKLRPKVWAWESVVQAYTKGNEFVKELEDRALALGYSVTYLLHNAEWLGLPQTRNRFFMICHNIRLPIPAPNWAPPPTPGEVLAQLPRELVGNLEGGDAGRWSLKSFPKEVLAQVPPGMRLRAFWEKQHPPATWVYKDNGDVAGRPSYGHCRLPLERPSGAVVGYGIVHPTEDRFITINEMKLLCGFPIDYKFVPKGLSACASEIARGVCPPVGEWLAGHVARALLQGERQAPEVREIDYREPPQEDEQVVRKTRVARVAREPAVKVSLRDAAPPPSPAPPPESGKGSGVYIQRLLLINCYSDAEILDLIYLYFPASKATGADVSYHRGKLKAAGTPVERVIQLADGSRKFK